MNMSIIGTPRLVSTVLADGSLDTLELLDCCGMFETFFYQLQTNSLGKFGPPKIILFGMNSKKQMIVLTLIRLNFFHHSRVILIVFLILLFDFIC
jgi:hypothetical protein